MRPVPFVKMSGTGNDFVLVDNRTGFVPEGEKAALARLVCRRRFSVGADGLLLLERSDAADVRMRVFNPDGSEAEMCGNGARCMARFAFETGAAPESMTMETLAGTLHAEVLSEAVKIELTRPSRMKQLDVKPPGAEGPEKVWCMNTGVPHAVVFVTDLEGVDVAGRGGAVRRAPEFKPAGANADFVQVVGKGVIAVRTYERGVEAETLACGTGAVAAGLLAAAREGWRSPVEVRVRSGERLLVHFEGEPGAPSAVHLEGKVRVTFRGEFDRGAEG